MRQIPKRFDAFLGVKERYEEIRTERLAEVSVHTRS